MGLYNAANKKAPAHTLTLTLTLTLMLGMECNKVKRSTRKGKKIMKLYCKNGKKHLVHAGDTNYGNNYSDRARKAFRARHDCAHAPWGTAEHLACTELWKKGGRTTAKKKHHSK